jgi:hypothetical protein
MKRMILALAIAGLSVAVSASPPPGAVGPPARGTLAQAPGRSDAALAAFRTALEQDGFDVHRGDTVALNFVASWCGGTPIPGYGSALYSNNQRYLQLLVPKSAQDPDQLTSVFQLDPAEAIVLIGLTPPPERYFGFTPFLRYRVEADGSKQPLWATVGDIVKNATVKTIGSTPFDSPVAFIFTPDRGTDARVRKALQRAGYPAAIINTTVFPASLLHLGHGDTGDEFAVVLRNAQWEEGAEDDGEAYIENPPFSLYRVTPTTATVANPFPVPPLRVRGTGQTEMDLMKALDRLRDAIIDSVTEVNPGYSHQDVRTEPGGYEGYDYIQRGIDPLGDARDAFALFAGYMPEWDLRDEITLEDDEFLMVYGVNHVATGKATYMNFNIYASRLEDGKVPIGGADDRTFAGSAAAYLPADPAASLMYAFKVSRNCRNEPNCLPLALEDCPRLTIDNDTVLGLLFRMYLEPATKVGAAMPEILYDRVIKFSPRAPKEAVIRY